MKTCRISSINSLRRITIDLEFIQVDSDPVVEIQFAVVQQSSGGIGVAIDDGNPVQAQPLELHRRKETGGAGSDDQYIYTLIIRYLMTARLPPHYI